MNSIIITLCSPIFWLAVYLGLSYSSTVFLIHFQVKRLLSAPAGSLIKATWNSPKGQAMKAKLLKPWTLILIAIVYILLAPVLFPVMLIAVLKVVSKPNSITQPITENEADNSTEFGPPSV